MSGTDSPPTAAEAGAGAGPANPWPGLASYTEQERELFHGRDREKAELLRLIERESLTVLFGRSGSGKTSLLRAGVIPLLREKAYLPVVLRIDYANQALSPFQQVKALLQEAAKANDVELENVPPHEVTLWEYFHTVEFWGPRNDQLTPILVLDQFEEAFTIGRGHSATAEFLDQLADLVENRPPRALQDRTDQTNQALPLNAASRNYKIVLSLREDYVSKLDSLRPLMPAVMRNRMGLNPLDGERALGVIVQAGKQWITEDVARDIAAAVAGGIHDGDSLPVYQHQAEIEPAYLSVMCHELFRRMVALGRDAITRDLVQDEQGGILERLYERSFEGLDPKVRTFVEDKLVSSAGFRLAVPQAEAVAEGLSDRDLGLVVDRRLLRFDDRLGTRYVELSHDLLTRVVQKSRDGRRAAKLRRDLVRSRIRGATAGGFGLLCLGLLVLCYFGYFHEFTIYSANLQKRFGMEKPIDVISREAVRHRNWSFKFVRKGFGFKPFRGKVLSVSVIDSTGHLTDRHPLDSYLSGDSDDSTERPNPVCQLQLVYDPDGRVTYEIGRDRFDRMLYGMVYSPESQRRGRSNLRRAMFVGPDGYPQPQRQSSAEYIEIIYDEGGQEIRWRFSDREGHLAPGPDGAFGRSFEYDRKGRQTRITSLDKLGEPMNDNAGNSTAVAEYDGDGNEKSASFLDRRGRLTLLKDGFAKATSANDRWGNTIEERYFGPRDQPVSNSQVGSEVGRARFDEHGNRVELSFFDRHGEAAYSSVFSVHAVQIDYDDQDRPTSRRFLDTSMHPMLGSGGFHEVRSLYDRFGFVREEQYLDERGGPAKTQRFRYVMVNDDHGRHIEERAYKADGSPAPLPDEIYYIRENQFDDRGNMVAQAFYDAAHKPARDSANDAHKIVHEYDRFSNATVETYFGDDGVTPMNSRKGFHRFEASYDSFGNATSNAYFDASGRPAAVDGIHRYKAIYDERGLLLETTTYGADGKPVNNHFGVYLQRYEYNDKRQMTRAELFDVNGKPALGKDGYFRLIAEFDEAGNRTRVTSINRDGSGFLFQTPGVATERIKYDAEDREIARSFVDVNDRPITGPNGYFKWTTTYSGDGTQEDAFYGVDDRLFVNGLYGYARSQMRYRGDQRVLLAFYAADGALINGPDGFASQTVEGAPDNGEIERFLDQNKKPALGVKGYSERRSRRVGRKTENSYFDIDHQPIDHPEDGFPIVYVSSIHTTQTIAFKMGMVAGDVLWRLGDWFLPAAVESARAGGTGNDDMEKVLMNGFVNARDACKTAHCRLEVVRSGKVVSLSVPAMLEGKFGFDDDVRRMPKRTFQQTFGQLVASSPASSRPSEGGVAQHH